MLRFRIIILIYPKCSIKIINQNVVEEVGFFGVTKRSFVLGGSYIYIYKGTFLVPFMSPPFFFVLSRIFILFSLSLLFSVENFQQKRMSTIIMTKTE